MVEHAVSVVCPIDYLICCFFLSGSGFYYYPRLGVFWLKLTWQQSSHSWQTDIKDAFFDDVKTCVSVAVGGSVKCKWPTFWGFIVLLSRSLNQGPMLVCWTLTNEWVPAWVNKWSVATVSAFSMIGLGGGYTTILIVYQIIFILLYIFGTIIFDNPLCQVHPYVIKLRLFQNVVVSRCLGYLLL